MSAPNQDPIALYRSNLLELLAETFERVQGYFLDRDTSLDEPPPGPSANPFLPPFAIGHNLRADSTRSVTYP